MGIGTKIIKAAAKKRLAENISKATAKAIKAEKGKVYIRVGPEVIKTTPSKADATVDRFKNAKVIDNPNEGQIDRAQTVTADLGNFTGASGKRMVTADRSRPSVGETVTSKARSEGQEKLRDVKTGKDRRASTVGNIKGVAGIVVGGAGVGAAMSSSNKKEKAQANTIADLKKDIVSMKAALRKSRTETEKEKLKARIEKAMAKLAAAELKAEKNKPKAIGGVKRSLRPKLRPKNLKDGGMPMVMKDGKKVPAYAADGVGKMNKGGMAMKKKPTTKMMAGGMAKKKMMAGGMTKSNYMYGGMAKKPKAKK